MKKLLFLPMLLITAIFIGCLIHLSTKGFQAQNPVSLQSLETANTSETQNNEITAEGKININTASKETLMLLTGIGEGLSQRIIEYRNENGPYRDVSDLLNVKGIGEETLDGIIAQIAVE